MYIDEKEQKIILREGEKFLRTFLIFSKDLLREDVNDYFKNDLLKSHEDMGNTPEECCVTVFDKIIKKFNFDNSDTRWIKLLSVQSAIAPPDLTSISLKEKGNGNEWAFTKKAFYYDCEEKHVVAVEVMEIYRLQKIMPLLWFLYKVQSEGSGK
jgi:hypothetical protein